MSPIPLEQRTQDQMVSSVIVDPFTPATGAERRDLEEWSNP